MDQHSRPPLILLIEDTPSIQRTEKNALESLVEGGFLLMTTYLEDEAKIFKGLIPDGYCVKSFGLNPFFCSHKYAYKPGKFLGKDLFQMLIKKDSSYSKRRCYFSFFLSTQ